MSRLYPMFTILPLAVSLLAAPAALAQQRDTFTTQARDNTLGDFAAEADDGATHREQLSDVELRLTCSEGWLTIHEEDENGQPVPGSYEYECLYGEDM